MTDARSPIEYDKRDQRRSDWEYDVLEPERRCPYSRQGNGSHPTVQETIVGRQFIRYCRHCNYELSSRPVRPIGEVPERGVSLDE